jgi:hypothetical protein
MLQGAGSTPREPSDRPGLQRQALAVLIAVALADALLRRAGAVAAGLAWKVDSPLLETWAELGDALAPATHAAAVVGALLVAITGLVAGTPRRLTFPLLVVGAGLALWALVRTAQGLESPAGMSVVAAALLSLAALCAATSGGHLCLSVAAAFVGAAGCSLWMSVAGSWGPDALPLERGSDLLLLSGIGSAVLPFGAGWGRVAGLTAAAVVLGVALWFPEAAGFALDAGLHLGGGTADPVTAVLFAAAVGGLLRLALGGADERAAAAALVLALLAARAEGPGFMALRAAAVVPALGLAGRRRS